MKAVLFCLSNLCALWMAARWASAITVRRMDFVVGLAALFPLCATLVMIIGGLAGHLDPLHVTFASIVIVTVLMVKYGPRVCWPSCEEAISTQNIAARISIGVVILFASIPLLRVVKDGTGYFIDDFGYHAVAVASWIQHGDFSRIMPQFMAYLPLNAELLSGWFALPYHDDTVVALAGIVWLAMAGTSAAGLARLAGGGTVASALVYAAVLASEPLVWQTRTFSACDLAGSASLLAATYFALSATRARRLDQALVSGLLGGLAAGTKATFLPVCAVLCLFPFFTTSPWRSRRQLSAVMMAAAFITGSLWYLHNWITTGNPLFPAEVGPFAGPLTRTEQTYLRLSGMIALVPWTMRLWGNMILDYLDWPLPLGALALCGYLRTIYLEFVPSTGTLEARPLRRLLLLAGATQFILQCFAPFCMGGGFIDGRILVFARYVMPWFLFGLVSAAPLLDSRTRFHPAWRLLLGAGLVWCWPVAWNIRLASGAVALLGLALLVWLPSRLWRPLIWASLIGIWPLLALLGPKIRATTDRSWRDSFHTKSGASLGQALLALETLPPGAHLARFANQDYLNAPLFGRNWQFAPIFTNGNGIPLAPLDQQFRIDRHLTFLHAQQHVFPSPKEFLDNLRAAGISDIFVTKFDTADWPPQQRLLEESGGATTTFSDGDSALWHLTETAR